ncbi:MAG: hypothetical protein Q8R37_00135 [Nanoarchaeota archaeon]|nr:hypothetical protein [Nanoarchaeota archaeon]
MYKQVELYDQTSANIKTQDLTRLEQVLELMSERIGQLGTVTPQTDLETLTYRAGMATAELFMESQLPTTTSIGFCDGQVHPIRSLGYYGLGCFYAEIESCSDYQKAVFQSTQRYFKDVFLVQEAIALEGTRDLPNEKYLVPLRSVLESLAVEYPKEITRQTDAYDELLAAL